MTRIYGITGRKRAGKNTFAALLQPQPYAHVAFADPIKQALIHINPMLSGRRITGSFSTTAEQHRLLQVVPKALIEDTTINPAIVQRFILSGKMAQLLDLLDPFLETEHGQSPLRLLEIISTPADFEQHKIPGNPVNDEIRRLMQVLGTEVGRQGIHPDIWVDTAAHAINERTKRFDPVVITDVRFDDEARAIRQLGGTIIEIRRADLPPPDDAHASERGIDPELIDAIVDNDGDLDDLLEKTNTFR